MGNPVSKGMLLPTTPWDTATHLCLRDSRAFSSQTLLSVGSQFCPPERMLLDTFSHTCPQTVWVPAQAVCSAHHLINPPSPAPILFLTHPLPPSQRHKNMFQESSIYNWAKLLRNNQINVNANEQKISAHAHVKGTKILKETN